MFWPLQSNFEVSEVPADSQVPISGVRELSPHSFKVGLRQKVLQLCTNHLVSVLCRSVWVIEACHFFLVPSQSSSTPFYPSIMLWTRERPWLFTLLLFLVWDSHLSPSRSWEHVTFVGMGYLNFYSVDRCYCQSSTSPSKPKTCHLDSIVTRRLEPKKKTRKKEIKFEKIQWYVAWWLWIKVME